MNRVAWRVVIEFSGIVCAAAMVTAMGAPSASADADENLQMHVLNRITFGPNAVELDRIREIGVDRYIDEQLHPDLIPVPASLQTHLAADDIVGESQGELIGRFREDAKAVRKGGDDAKEARKEDYKRGAIQMGDARLERAIESPRQLQEVMVDFWYNHFNVYQGKGLDRVLVANYEREAIRPHVLGKFRDLLGATAHHPAMLFYLDNYLSTSATYRPRNPNAKQQAGGLNENYAREVMELHTLGVDGGYSQQDVTELARMLTGWTFDPRANGASLFRFDGERHDWGDKNWLNHHVAPRGQEEGEWALDVLASSPQTAHHISYQLAQYFVSDTPSDALVAALTATYKRNDGDIREVLKTLFASQEFRDPANFGSKFKTPYQYVISAVRASDLATDNVVPLMGMLNQLGMPLYGCQTPDGYKNTADAWINPDAMTKRIGFATALASGRVVLERRPDNQNERLKTMPALYKAGQGEVPVDPDPLAAVLGSTLSMKTRQTVASAQPQLRAAMILGSPDFMRH